MTGIARRMGARPIHEERDRDEDRPGGGGAARGTSSPGATGRRWRSHNLPLLLIALPALLALLVFYYLPMLGIYIAFVDYRPARGVFGSEWVGFENFDFLFRSGDGWRITFNTVVMNSLFIVATLVTALAIALMLNELRDRWKWLSRFYQSILFLPYFFSYVIVSYFVMAFLDPDRGLVNHAFGLGQHNWYAEPGYWPIILTVVSVWKGVGFWVIVYTAGILAIGPELLEAAQIDGASKWRQIYHVILPILTPLIIVQLLLSIGNIFRADFGLFYLVTNNSTLLYPSTDVIDTYIYRSMTKFGDIGMASAAGAYQCVVGFVLVVLANWLVRRRNPENALF
ncbi:ABC transporter permease subunit [Nonomuraea sp. NPDC046802]|uniref:ABC transporter permease n=1 Tax=Nonomuraea sp. NPDC046802 TaxID=3154919 RepID=UPI0034000CEB